MNKIYIPKSALPYFEDQFHNPDEFYEVVELETSDENVRLEFKNPLSFLDLQNIFFAGAYWGNHILLHKNQD